MRVVVTGGRGFIGSRLVAALKSRGDAVTVIDLEEDVTSAKLPDADIVYHLAAVSRVEASYRDPEWTSYVNVLGTYNVLQQAHCPVIFTSTLHRGVSPYAVTKRAAESLCQRFKHAQVVRLGNVYGGGEGVIDKWLKAQVLCINGDGRTRKDFIHVDDVVAGLLSPKAAKCSNLCSGQTWTLNELAKLYGKPVVHRCESPGDWSVVPTDSDYPVTWTVRRYVEEALCNAERSLPQMVKAKG